MILPILFIAPSPKGGRGVFCTEDIPAGTVIEISPVLPLDAAERKDVEKTALYNYVFEWGEDGGVCVAWGYLSMYNHDYNANCVYEMDIDNEFMRITTVRDITEGEELLVNYNAEPGDETPVWFETK